MDRDQFITDFRSVRLGNAQWFTLWNIEEWLGKYNSFSLTIRKGLYNANEELEQLYQNLALTYSILDKIEETYPELAKHVQLERKFLAQRIEECENAEPLIKKYAWESKYKHVKRVFEL